MTTPREPTPPTPIRPPLREIRCPSCKALIILARLAPGSELEGKCYNCNAPITVPLKRVA